MRELRVVELRICRGSGGFGRWVERFCKVGSSGFELGGERFCEIGSSGFRLEMRGLFRWAGVSDEDGFVRRMEWIWRLGAAGFDTPENVGPCRGSRCLLSGVKRKSIMGGWMSACSHKRKFGLDCRSRGTDSVSLLDGHSDQAPPLKPRAVIKTYLRIAQQVFQNEPCLIRPPTNDAISDRFLICGDALAGIQLL